MTAREDDNRYRKYMERAQGWLALGKVDAAALAIEEIPFSRRLETPVVSFRCQLYLQAQRWDIADMLAKRLVEVRPDQPEHWIFWAFAVRRLRSINEAAEILRRAFKIHPDCGAILFNLACYASQEGRYDEVGPLLTRARMIDRALERAALVDPDLRPYWASLSPLS